MALTLPASLCVTVMSAPGEICIDFPGGATLCAQTGYEFGDPTDIIKSLFAQFNAGLAPLMPFFNVLDVAITTFECLQAVPDMVGPPPDPTKLVECLAKLSKAVDKLLKLVPQLSIPSMIVGFLDAVILLLTGIKVTLQTMITKSLQITASEERAAQLGNVHLQAIVDCARANLDVQLVNMNAGLAPLNRLLAIVNAFMQIAKLGCIPNLSGITSVSADVLEPIDTIISILQAIRDAVPSIPAIELDSGGDC